MSCQAGYTQPNRRRHPPQVRTFAGSCAAFLRVFILAVFCAALVSCMSMRQVTKRIVTPFFYMTQHDVYAAFSVPQNREFSEALFKIFFPTADDASTEQLLSAIKFIYAGIDLNAGTRDMELVLTGAFPVFILNNAIAKQRGWSEQSIGAHKYFRHGTGFELYISPTAIFFASTVKQMLGNMDSGEKYPFDTERAPAWMSGKERFTDKRIAFFVPRIMPLLPAGLSGLAAFLGAGTLAQSSAEGTLVQNDDNTAEITVDADLGNARSVQALLPLVRGTIEANGMRVREKQDAPSHLAIEGTLKQFNLYDIIRQR
ncbi:MAG: hypothetical protein Ta2A_21860 [Treponemataceae bacterium]|nr:MAG: hypothetical protein Ta2A_21860 [Treponemataceae bacterium]